MAVGGLRGTLTANGISQVNPSPINGSVANVAIGDLVYAVFGQQTACTVGVGSVNPADNLGNTYAWCQAGTDTGTPTARAAWSIVTTGGTLTQITAAATASANNYANFAAVIEGPFLVNASQPAANPTNLSDDITSPFTCPSTTTLPQQCVVMSFYVCASNATFAATSPNLLAGQATSAALVKTVIGYQLVTASLAAVIPEFTGTNPSTQSVLGTTAFSLTNQGLAPSLKTTENVFYDPWVGVILDQIGQVSSIYDPVILASELGQIEYQIESEFSQDLTPALVTTSNAFYAPTVATGAVDVTPDLFSNSSTFYAPTVATGVVDVTPDLFTNTSTFYAPTVNVEGGTVTIDSGSLTLSGSIITETDIVGIATGGPNLIVGGDWATHNAFISQVGSEDAYDLTESGSTSTHYVDQSISSPAGYYRLEVVFHGIGPSPRGMRFAVLSGTDGVETWVFADGSLYAADQWGLVFTVTDYDVIDVGGGNWRAYVDFISSAALDLIELQLVNDDLQSYAGENDGSGIEFRAATLTNLALLSLGPNTEVTVSDVAPGAVDITPDLFTNSSTFYAPTVATGVVDVTPDLFTNTSTFYAPTVAVGAVDITPDLFTNTSTFYAPTVATGGIDVTPDLFTNTSTFYAPTVATGAVDITPDLFTNTSTFYAPTVATGGIGVTPDLLTNTSTFYAPTVATGEVTLTIALFTNTSTFYAPTATDNNIISITAAAISLSSSSITEVDVVGITAAALSLSNSDIATTDTGSDTIIVDSASLTLSANAITEVDIVGITAAALSLAASDLTEIDVVGITSAGLSLNNWLILEVDSIGITAAALSLSGSDVAVSETDRTVVDSAALVLSGSEITEVDTVSISSIALVLAGSEIVLTGAGEVPAAGQKDGDPDYWKLPWLHLEGATFSERLLAKAFEALEESANAEPRIAKQSAKKAAKAVRAYTKAAGPLLSDEETAALDRLIRRLRASQRVESIQPRVEETRALLIAQVLQRDEEEALIALGIL